MKRKSQITMLMLIGLVLFIVVSLVLYLSKTSIKKTIQSSTKKIQETALDVRPIKELATKCVDKLAKDAVVLLGKQGGYIYTSQGGTLIDYSNADEGLFFVKYNDNNIVYNIKMPQFTIFPYTSNIPEYPWQFFPYINPNSNTEKFEGIFGIDNMPPLTPAGGSHSIQTQIETFIDKNMPACLNFDIFEEQGFVVDMQPSNTSVVIGTKDLSVTSKIPIKINNPTTKEFTELRDFSTNINIRLRDIYYFVKELIENDIRNIKFNISDFRNNRDFLSVRTLKNIYNNDDLIIITDEKSLIYGKPFEYVFARKNRAPALYFIRNNVIEFENGYTITKEDLERKIGVLKAEDPDEDSLTFNIIPSLPYQLDGDAEFRIEVSDGRLSDYQIVDVNIET